MNALQLHLPGSELVDQTLAEFVGYFWCRFSNTSQVVGSRVVRFLMNAAQFERASVDWPGGVIRATGDEPIEQLAYRAIPSFHDDPAAMATVESQLWVRGMSELYVRHLLETTRALNPQLPAGQLTPDVLFFLATAPANVRAQAAYVLIDAQKPKQMLLG